MTRPAIIINEFDAERIDRLLEQPAYANSPVANALNDELDRAQMCAPEAMPHDVVSMNSQVRFRDLTTGEERVRTLVFPAQMTDSSRKMLAGKRRGKPLCMCWRGDAVWRKAGLNALSWRCKSQEQQEPRAARARAAISG